MARGTGVQLRTAADFRAAASRARERGNSAFGRTNPGERNINRGALGTASREYARAARYAREAGRRRSPSGTRMAGSASQSSSSGS